MDKKLEVRAIKNFRAKGAAIYIVQCKICLHYCDISPCLVCINKRLQAELSLEKANAEMRRKEINLLRVNQCKYPSEALKPCDE